MISGRNKFESVNKRWEAMRRAFIISEEKEWDILNLFEYPLFSDKKELAPRITFSKPYTVSFFERSSWQWRKPDRGWWVCLPSVDTPEELPFPPLQHYSVLCGKTNYCLKIKLVKQTKFLKN